MAPPSDSARRPLVRSPNPAPVAGAAVSRGPAPQPWESQPGRPAAPATQREWLRLPARSPAPAPLIDIMGVWSKRRVCSRRLAGSEYGANDLEGEIFFF